MFNIFVYLVIEFLIYRTHVLSQDPTKKYDQQRGGGMSLAGAGETYLQKASRIINGQISKTKKELEKT